MRNGKIIKWLGLEPLKKIIFKVELIENEADKKPINYKGFEDALKHTKVGTHLKEFNTLFD